MAVVRLGSTCNGSCSCNDISPFINDFINAISMMMFWSPFPGGTVVAFEIGPTIDTLRYSTLHILCLFLLIRSWPLFFSCYEYVILISLDNCFFLGLAMSHHHFHFCSIRINKALNLHLKIDVHKVMQYW